DSLVVSGAKDNEVRVWAVPSGRCLAVGVGHVGAVAAVALSRKQPGKLFVSGGADKLLKVWDLAAMLTARAEAEATARTTQEGLNAVDGQPVKKKKKKEAKAEQTGASLNGPSPIGVLALRASAAVAAHDKDINCVVVSPNDQLVASGSQDRTAKVWRLPSLTPVAVLRGHRRGVWCVEFSPVDQALLTSSGDKTIKLWSLADGGSCIRTFDGSQASVLRASFITAGTQVLSAGADGLVKLWSVKSGECQATYDEHAGKIWAMSTGGSQDSMM
ncbi:WD_REPEATS_REGION domain-containing protein, partial [Haematococcus lacustris]